ncbi:MAG: ABC transporter permease [Desulfobacteraceae bacterium]|nr:ABC transporter permease [Desulfobacteraceae bacterium]
MLKFIITRIISVIPILFLVSILVFLMVHFIPGDPVINMLGMEAQPEAIEATRERLGLNKPLHIQYTSFLINILKGDLGTSIRTKKPVIQEIKDKYRYSLILAIGGTLVASVLGVLMGIVSAIKQNKFWDNFLMVISLLSVSTPSFFLALILILIFSLFLGWFPSIGVYSWRHYVLPIFALGTQSIGLIARMTRSAMLDTLNQDYITTAKAKGAPWFQVVFSHALRNAMIPVLTILGLRFGGLLAGSALIEMVFAIPGIGRLMIDAVLTRDYPVIQATVLFISVTFVMINLIVDILYSIVDPRVKC